MSAPDDISLSSDQDTNWFFGIDRFITSNDHRINQV